MKKTYNVPEIAISVFDMENVATTASIVASVKEELAKTDAVVTLDGKSGESLVNLVDFTW